MEIVQFAGSDSLKIQSTDGHVTALVSSHEAHPRGKQEDQLIFNRYEDKYFLAQITGIDGMTQYLAPTRTEKEIAKTAGASVHQVTVTIHKR
jgi:hypothetical protein